MKPGGAANWVIRLVLEQSLLLTISVLFALIIHQTHPFSRKIFLRLMSPSPSVAFWGGLASGLYLVQALKTQPALALGALMEALKIGLNKVSERLPGGAGPEDVTSVPAVIC
jgi:hypothetical protein